MLDPVAYVGPGPASLRLLDRVQHEVDGGVADRVRGDPPAGAVRVEDPGAQRGGVVLQEAALARGVGEVLASSRRCGRSASRR